VRVVLPWVLRTPSPLSQINQGQLIQSPGVSSTRIHPTAYLPFDCVSQHQHPVLLSVAQDTCQQPTCLVAGAERCTVGPGIRCGMWVGGGWVWAGLGSRQGDACTASAHAAMKPLCSSLAKTVKGQSSDPSFTHLFTTNSTAVCTGRGP